MLVIANYLIGLGIIKLIMLEKFNKKVFVILAGSILFFIAAFRSVYFGTDVLGYVNRYISMSHESINLYWNNFINFEGKDPFFYLVTKMISISGVSHQVWIAILSGVFIYAVSKLIYRYSEEPYLSYLALISLGYFFFSLTGLRQALALSVILISYKYLIERRLVPFIALVVIGSLFHASALVFLIAYPIAKMKVGVKQVAGIIVALIITTYFGGIIRYLIETIGWTETVSSYAEREATLNYTGFIIQLFILMFCLIYKKVLVNLDEKSLGLYNLLFLGLLFQAFAVEVAEFFRVSMYFSIFSIILIPKAIVAEKDKNIKVIIYLAILLSLVVYIFWTGAFNDFKFYWNQ